MAHRRFVLLGIGGVIALVVALTLTSLGENLTYYLYPTEAVAQKADFPDGERFRLAGTVVTGTLVEGEDQIVFRRDRWRGHDRGGPDRGSPALLGEEVPVLRRGGLVGG